MPSGPRDGGSLGLRRRGLNHDAATLRVVRSPQWIGGAVVLKEPKTERSRRIVSLPASATAALRAHRDRQA